MATPMHGATCTGPFCASLVELGRAAERAGIGFRLGHVYGDSLVTRARDALADEFLRSPAAHLLFVDGDVAFRAGDALDLLDRQVADERIDVLAGAYPRKAVAWEKVQAAVDAGAGRADPTALARYAGDLVLNLLPGTRDVPLDEPVEVAEIGTGFMLIRRATLEALVERHADRSYVPDELRRDHDPDRRVVALFEAGVDESSGRYLSEDWAFCGRVRSAGMRVWWAPWVRLDHIGVHRYVGDPGALASIGASATYDPRRG